MKKLLIILTIISILFLVGCNKNQNNPTNQGGTTTPTNQEQDNTETYKPIPVPEKQYYNFTNDELLNKVKNYVEASGYGTPTTLEVTAEENNFVTIHVVTSAIDDLYYLDRLTGTGSNSQSESIFLDAPIVAPVDVSSLSFEERTSDFASVKAEISKDASKQFANVRLDDMDDRYMLSADVYGSVKISNSKMQAAISKIQNEKLDSYDVDTTNGQRVTIFSKVPSQLDRYFEDGSNYDDPNMYDDDWRNAKSSEWLYNGVPMFVEAMGFDDYFGWALLKKQGDDFYLYKRENNGGKDTEELLGVVDYSVLDIALLADDIIVLCSKNGSTLTPVKEMTVKAYSDASPSSSDGLRIDSSSMSHANGNVGLDIRDGKVYVVAKVES